MTIEYISSNAAIQTASQQYFCMVVQEVEAAHKSEDFLTQTYIT
jgi:hypothetical protein